MLDSTVGKVTWMNELEPRSSYHLGLGIAEVKLTTTDKARTTQVIRLLLQPLIVTIIPQ